MDAAQSDSGKIEEDISTNRSAALYFPGTSPTVLSSTTTTATTFYDAILAGHTWGLCQRFRNGMSLLTATSYSATERTYEFTAVAYPSRDCTGQRITQFSYQNNGRILSFARSTQAGIWYESWQNLSSTTENGYFMRLVDGKIEVMPSSDPNLLRNVPFVASWTYVLLR